MVISLNSLVECIINSMIGFKERNRVKGLWKDPKIKSADGNYLYFVTDEDEKGHQERICEEESLGITFFQQPKRIVFCDNVWRKKISLKADHDGGLAGDFKWPTQVSQAGIFLHEMMHWLDDEQVPRHSRSLL
jgi:hypothetical protein